MGGWLKQCPMCDGDGLIYDAPEGHREGRGMGDGIGPEAYAAYDARKLTAHEPGTWPAFRDGYAAGLRAACTPGPDVARLVVAAKFYRKIYRESGYMVKSFVLGIHDATIAEFEAATK